MYNIVIGIPTYKRPLMLQNLVVSISRCNVNKSFIKTLDIVVIDNDMDRTAESTVTHLSDTCSGFFNIHYCNYPVKGLSNVRNELIRRAMEFNPDYIVSIDDDEYATRDWLNELVLTVSSNNGDIAVGPVIPEFENRVSPFISYWFRYHDLINHQITRVFETNNYIISVKFLSEHKLQFDNRFNSTGAEDSYFRITVLKKGARIYWARDAVAYETIPQKRAKLGWLIMRNFRSAITYTYILKLEKNHVALLKKTIVSAFYLGSGFISLILLPLPIRWKYWGIIKLAESIGGFAGLFDFKYHEYAKAR